MSCIGRTPPGLVGAGPQLGRIGGAAPPGQLVVSGSIALATPGLWVAALSGTAGYLSGLSMAIRGWFQIDC